MAQLNDELNQVKRNVATHRARSAGDTLCRHTRRTVDAAEAQADGANGGRLGIRESQMPERCESMCRRRPCRSSAARAGLQDQDRTSGRTRRAVGSIAPPQRCNSELWVHCRQFTSVVTVTAPPGPAPGLDPRPLVTRQRLSADHFTLTVYARLHLATLLHQVRGENDEG
eukprot:2174573-Prymnesium_polylepis.1